MTKHQLYVFILDRNMKVTKSVPHTNPASDLLGSTLVLAFCVNDSETNRIQSVKVISEQEKFKLSAQMTGVTSTD